MTFPPSRPVPRTPHRLRSPWSGLLGAILMFAVAAAGEEPWPEKTPEGFRIPQPDAALTFPAAHGSHPDFRIEWWYLTGHLFERGEGTKPGARRFGVQATFFRLANRPGGSGETGAAFGSDPLYLAHMALTDVAGGRFLHEERLNREGWDARARVGDLEIHNGNWSLRRLDGLGPGDRLEDSAVGTMALKGSIRSEVRFDLRLAPVKPPVLFGKRGVSRKGPEPAASSRYLTCPRLLGTGELEIGGETLEVGGELWMDHEVSSSQLGRDQVGWDWASIQFFDGRELMAYILRRPDGTPDPFSALAWIDGEGRVTEAAPGEFEWQSRGDWRSGETGDVYPIQPRVSATDPATGERRTFRLQPVFEAQEMTGTLGGVSYWEGACDVIELPSGEVVGRAYLELTGYASGDDLGRRLRGG